MKTIGLIGGITPQSTIMYYEILNELANKEYGGKHSAKVVIHSLDFGVISQYQQDSRWDLLDEIMANAGKSLEKAGAEIILICANTMHLCISAIRKLVTVPIIHIATVTATQINQQELKTVALLGTKYTMEKTFFTEILSQFGIKTIIPDFADREIINSVIYNELSKREIKNSSKESFKNIIKKLQANGAEGVILGCTEIPLLIKQEDSEIPVFDTTRIHATKAFKLSIYE